MIGPKTLVPSRLRWVFVLAGLAVAEPSPAQRPVRVHGVKQLDTGMQVCERESGFEVSLRDGLIGRLEILVGLQPAVEPLGTDIILRIELLDAGGHLVALADSTETPAEDQPPWLVLQAETEAYYLFTLQNRRPKPGSRIQRYKIRVSVDSVKNSGMETKAFWLYWPELGGQFCKHNPPDR